MFKSRVDRTPLGPIIFLSITEPETTEDLIPPLPGTSGPVRLALVPTVSVRSPKPVAAYVAYGLILPKF